MEKFKKTIDKSLSTDKGNETHVFLSYNPNILNDVNVIARGNMPDVARLLASAILSLNVEQRVNVYTHLVMQDDDVFTEVAQEYADRYVNGDNK